MKIKSLLSACVASGALLSGASAAVAGGFVAQAVDVEPIVVAPTAPTATWAGGYAGGSLGYSFGGDDVVGLNADDEGGFGLAEVNVKGFTGGVHAGFRWQRGNWVFGPELGIEGGSVDASDTAVLDGLDIDIESSVNYILTLALKTGYVVNPQTLVYGTFGAARGDFDYSATAETFAQTVSYNRTGWVAGLGVERAFTPTTSVFAEYQFRDFGSETITFTEGGEDLDTIATPKHSNIKVGVNFRF